MRPPLFAAIILFAGSLVAGLGYCALLPPFEGFDETAHYSYIQQIAQTGTWNDSASADVDDYLNVAPRPGALKARWSYQTFFKASADTVQAGAAVIHDERNPARPWRAGIRTNWEGQHPPLYYMLLAPVWSVSKGWSISAQFLLLRGVSYLLAWGGLVIATFSIAWGSAASPMAPLLVVGPALWPALFPMWFPEMARLGNDSLVLLLLSLAWAMTRRAIGARGKTLHFALLGAICGLGLLTKATVLPFVAVLGLFMTWRAWRTRGDVAALRASVSRLLVFCLVTAAIAGWWYAKNLIDYGDIVGSNDGIVLAQHGGLLRGLSAKFSLLMSIRGIAGNILSFVWAGTWSFIHPLRVTEVPLVIVLAVIAVGWIWHTARTKTISSLDAIAALTLVLFIIALLQHTLVFIALYGAFSLGAWYLHCLAPLLAPLVACGLTEAAGWRGAQPLVSALVIYPLLFLALATALELFHFAGCVVEPADDPYFGPTAIASCAASPREVLSHLAVLGNPALAIPLFSAGRVAILIGVVLVIAGCFFAPERRALSPRG
jgi:hypothetical protein